MGYLLFVYMIYAYIFTRDINLAVSASFRSARSFSECSGQTSTNILTLTATGKQEKQVEILLQITEWTEDLPRSTFEVIDHHTKITSILHLWELRLQPKSRRKASVKNSKNKTSEDDIRLDELKNRIAAIEKEMPSLMKLSNELIVDYEAYKITVTDNDILIYLLQPQTSKGRLSYFIEEKMCLGEDLVRGIAKGTLQSLSYLHQNGVVHRDLKDHNICTLDTQTGLCRIADYSVDRRILEAAMYYKNQEPLQVYPMSPGKGGQRKDVYRLAVILISLCSGCRMDKVSNTVIVRLPIMYARRTNSLVVTTYGNAEIPHLLTTTLNYHN